MNRTTKANLENLCNIINRETRSPDTYMTIADGKRTINIGHYHINYAYGGCKLVRTVNESGGIRCITDCYAPKAVTYDLMQMFRKGFFTKMGSSN